MVAAVAAEVAAAAAEIAAAEQRRWHWWRSVDVAAVIMVAARGGLWVRGIPRG